jgi:hypothetical protein
MFRPTPPSSGHSFPTAPHRFSASNSSTDGLTSLFSPRFHNSTDNDQQGPITVNDHRHLAPASSAEMSLNGSLKQRKSTPVVTIVDENIILCRNRAISGAVPIKYRASNYAMPASPSRSTPPSSIRLSASASASMSSLWTSGRGDIGLPGCRVTWDNTTPPTSHYNLASLVHPQHQPPGEVSPNRRTSPAAPPVASSEDISASPANHAITPPPSFCPFLPRALQPKEHIKFMPYISHQQHSTGGPRGAGSSTTSYDTSAHNYSFSSHSSAPEGEALHGGGGTPTAASARDVIEKAGGKEAFMRMMHATYHPSDNLLSIH